MGSDVISIGQAYTLEGARMTPTSLYREIPGFDGYYLDSQLRVISRHGRPMAEWIDADGYPRVTMATARGKNARRVKRGLHQIVCLVYHGPCPTGMQVRHLDGDTKNIRPDNLRYSTILINNRDRIAHGTVPRGERHGCSKLTEKQVDSIRLMSRQPHTRKGPSSDISIAKLFGVDTATVRNIRLGKTWRHSDGK